MTKNIIGNRADTLRDIMLLAAESQNGLDKAINTVSNKLLVVAKSFQEKENIKAKPDGERVEANSLKFVTATKGEEAFIKSKEAGDLQRASLPRCWTQAKSNIKAAIELGIDLAKYTSEAALRKEVIRVRGLKSANPIDQAVSEFKKMLKAVTEDEALAVLKQATAAIAAQRGQVKAEATKPAKTTKPVQARKPVKATKPVQARKPIATHTKNAEVSDAELITLLEGVVQQDIIDAVKGNTVAA